ncbi:GDSL lipase/esterase [Fomitopsis betulina]|nr:GDSL lipase/esterase [Fomitopsis betulina]
MGSLALFTTLAYCLAFAWTSNGQGPDPGQIKTIVTFGDSYTDRYGHAGDNGTAWPVYVADYANLTLYPYAIAGATCSNNLTYRPFSSVLEGQVPLYLQDKANGSISVDADSTIYTLWIGTNDVGANAVLTGAQSPGVTIVNTTRCAVDWVNVLYQSGARNFLFQNMLTLQDTVMYSADSYPNGYWTAQRNTTEWNLVMAEFVNAVNALSLAWLEARAPSFPGAHLGYFDSYGLFQNMYANPGNYLNGTAPLNITGCIKSCIFQVNESTSGPSDCTIAEGTAQDSFLWYDEVHPSEQSFRVVAREIADAITRNSTDYITWIL